MVTEGKRTYKHHACGRKRQDRRTSRQFFVFQDVNPQSLVCWYAIIRKLIQVQTVGGGLG